MTNERRSSGPAPCRFSWIEASLLFAAGALALMPSFLGRDLWRSDEARWAEVARELLPSNNWFVLRLLGAYYPDKPPLYFWVSAGSMKLAGGANAAIPRLLSAAAVMAVAFLVWRLGTRLFGSPVGLWAGLLWVSSLLVGFLGTAVAVDPFYTVWVVGACAAATLAVAKRKWSGATGLAFCLCVGAAVFTKGPVGLALPLAALGAAWILGIPLPRRTWIPVVGAVAAAAVPTAVWLFEAAGVVGSREILNQIGVNGFGYVAHSWSHPKTPWYFLGTFWRDFFPASLLFPAAVVALWPDRVRVNDAVRINRERQSWWMTLRAAEAERPGDFFLLAWFLAIFLLHSLVSGKRSPYMMPAFPAAALLIARAFVAGGLARTGGNGKAERLFVFLKEAGRWVLVAAAAVLALGGLLHPLYFPSLERLLTRDLSDTAGLKLLSLVLWQHMLLFAVGAMAAGIAWMVIRGKAAGRKTGKELPAQGPTAAGRQGEALLKGLVATGLLILVCGGGIVAPLMNPQHSGRSLLRAAAPYLANPKTEVYFHSAKPAWLLAWHLQQTARLRVIENNYWLRTALRKAQPGTILIIHDSDYEKHCRRVVGNLYHLAARGLVGTETYWVLVRNGAGTSQKAPSSS